MKKLWFKAKRYGYGWTPVTWQGWLTIGVFIILIVLNFKRLDSESHSGSDTLINFIPETVILVIILVFICSITGEKPGWHWGDTDKK